MSVANAVVRADDRSDARRLYWPTVLGAALIVAVAAWYFGASEVDLRPALKILMTGGVVAVLSMQWRWAPQCVVRTFPHFASVLLLASVWWALGTFAVPMFLLLFALPVFSAALVSRGWLEHAVAAAAGLATTVTAFVGSAAFRWHVERLDGLPRWLFDAFPAAEQVSRFDRSLEGRGYAVLLATFAVAMFAVALFGSAAARALTRMERRLEHSDRASRESRVLSAKLLHASSALEWIVRPRTGRVVSSNTPVSGAAQETVFDSLGPACPEALQHLLGAEGGGRLEAAVCRYADVHRPFDIEVESLELDGDALKRVRATETSAAQLAVATLDAIDIAVATLGPDRRMLFASSAFLTLFPEASVGTAAAAALDDVYGLPAAWWDIAPSRRGRARFRRGDSCYCARVCLGGLRETDAVTHLHVVPEEHP